MAIFHLIDSKPSALIVPDDNDDRNAATLARLFVAKGVPFHIAADESMMEGELEEFREYVINILTEQAFSPHIIVDCRFTTTPEDMLIDTTHFFPDVPILAATPHTTSSHLYSLLNNPNIARVNLLPGFFPTMQTIEFAPSPTMADDACLHAEQFLNGVGLKAERIDDIIGFIAPRIVAMLVNEAAFAVMEGVSSVSEIDAAMRLGTNYPKGPLTWADEIGIDVVLFILDALYAEYHQERYRACRLMRKYSDVGWLGVRTGKGFYDYDDDN
jgi:3-hydroxyacyl-CoA dehydrogenase, C-terminal domain